MTKLQKITLILAFAILLPTQPVKAECDGFYIAGRIGQAEYELKDDRSEVDSSHSDYVVDKKRLMASGALGYRYEHYRAELEYIWRKKNSEAVTDFTDGSFKSYSYMLNLYYDFMPYYWFTPYINAGIGYTRSKLSFANSTVDTHYSLKEGAFTWSLGAGLSLKITNRLNLDAGYRYFDMGELSIYNGKTKLSDQEIYAGLRYVL